MENNRVLETQLLARTLEEPALAKQVVAKNVTALLPDEIDKTIEYVAIRYYNESSIPMSSDLLHSRLSMYLNRENDKRARQGKEELSEEEIREYNTRADEVLSLTPDSSPEMADDLDRYVKDNLTTRAILEEAQRGEADLSYRVSKRMDEIKELNVKGNITKPFDVYDDLDEREKIYSEEYTSNKTPFGLAPLDDITRGGLQAGQVALVGAMSGSGKTTVMSNLSYYFSFKGGQNVLHISLEELATDQLVRFDRLAGNAGVNDIYNKDGTIKPYFVKHMNDWLSKKKGKHGMLRYVASMPNTLTVDDIRQQVISTERETGKKINVLMLDYADLLRSPTGNLSEAQIGEKLFQNLSKLAHEQNLVLITGTQLNRTSGDSDVKTLQSIEGSYRKINILALALTVNANKQEYSKGYVRLYIDKARNKYGSTDNFIYLKYNLKNMLLLPESEAELAEHKSLAGSDSSNKLDVKKSDKSQSMNEAIGGSLDKINDSLAKAFS